MTLPIPLSPLIKFESIYRLLFITKSSNKDHKNFSCDLYLNLLNTNMFIILSI